MKLSHCTKVGPPVELNALAWLPKVVTDAVAFAVAEPTFPLALALPLPETDIDMVTCAVEVLMVLLAPAEPAIASPALTTRPSNRQGEIKLVKTFIDTPHGIEMARRQLSYYSRAAKKQKPSFIRHSQMNFGAAKTRTDDGNSRESLAACAKFPAVPPT